MLSLFIWPIQNAYTNTKTNTFVFIPNPKGKIKNNSPTTTTTTPITSPTIKRPEFTHQKSNESVRAVSVCTLV